MPPRSQHHAFANEILRNDIHRFPPETWEALTGKDVTDSLAMQWEMAQTEDVALPSAGLGVEGVTRRGEWEILVVRMPPPSAPGEAYFIAMPRRPDNSRDLGYFVMEKGEGGPDHATFSEWREGGAHTRLGDLPGPTLDAFLDAVEREISARPRPAFAPAAGSKERSRPRRQHYSFAHVAVRDDVHRSPEKVWGYLTGSDWSAYLGMRWSDAQEPGENAPMQGLGVENIVRRGEWEILVIRMPPPEAPTEAHYIALPRRPQSPRDVGYFVMEKGISDGGAERAYMAEWRAGGSRIRMGDLPAPTLDAFLDAVAQEISSRPSPAFGALSLDALGSSGGAAGGGRKPGLSTGALIALIALPLLIVAAIFALR